MDGLDFDKGGGLLPVIVQDYRSGEVLMLAYLSRESWEKTLECGEAVYFSRSRQMLWHKGETSGHTQLIRDILIDCDRDTVIFKVDQQGAGACHTGHRSCFYTALRDGKWQELESPVFDSDQIYRKK